MFKETGLRHSVFQSESTLNPQVRTQPIIGRDIEIEKIAACVRPLTSKRKPENLLIYGPPGVGKTACVTHVLEGLENQTRVKTVHINCWRHNTRPSLLVQLLIELGYPAPRKGKPADELLLRIHECLDKNRSIVVVLDEFDQLDDAEQIVYDLYQASEDASNELGMILISNERRPDRGLDLRCQSRLNCQVLEFKQYCEEELVEILRRRAQDAFRPGAVTEHVLELIAEIVANEGGDCRQAFSLLLRAGRRADRENEEKVSVKHIRQSPFRPEPPWATE